MTRLFPPTPTRPRARQQGLVYLVQFGLILAALVLTLLVQNRNLENGVTQTIEFAVRDLAQQAIAKESVDPRIALVDIHEESLVQIAPWPWSRAQIAELVSKLITTHGADLVVLDVVLPSARDAPGDRQLLALAKDRRLVLSQVFDYAERAEPVQTGVTAGALTSPLPGLGRQTAVATGFVANHEGLAGAPCVGNIGFIPDADGKLRSLPLLTTWQGETFAGLALASLLCRDETFSAVTSDTPQAERLRYQREDTSWLVVPASVVLRPEDPSHALLPPYNLSGRIVIIGSSALGLADRVTTPLSANISGMFVHAHLLSELLDQPHVRQPLPLGLYQALQWVLVLVLGLSLSRIARLGLLLVTASGLFIAWAALAAWQASSGAEGVVTAALWGFFFLLLSLAPWEWFHDRNQARATVKLLSRYVSPAVLKRLLAQPAIDPLTPTSTEITVLVADMVGYAETIKRLSLDQSALLTKSLLTALTGPIWSNNGTLDRYTGDGLVAFWGAPVADEQQSQMAVQAAQQIRRALDVLNERFSAQNLPQVRVRIGIARGEALVGDFGTPYRSYYTAVGNCINLASRLESLADTLGQDILVNALVASALATEATVRLSDIEVKGFGSMAVYGLK